MPAIAAWIAPAATMIAATMTASNLGPRITGWGFVVFAVGSIAWCAVALSSGQQNLLWTNVFLLAVNAMGVWRWLGREARYAGGGERAAKGSAEIPVPALTPVAALRGRKLEGADGEPIGVVIDAMLRCSDARLAYIVVSEGGVAGMGERLHALPPEDFQLSADRIACRLDARALASRQALEPTDWPALAPSE